MAIEAALGGGLGGCVDHEPGQAFEVPGAERQGPGLFVGAHILGEGRAERGETLHDRREPLLACRVEAGAGAHEHAVVEHEHPVLLRGEPKGLAAGHERVDPGEERGVHQGLGGVRREPRGDRALKRLDRVVRMGGGEVEEHRRDPVERLLGEFHRLDRVGEGRRGGVGGDGVDIGAGLGEGAVEGRGEVLVADLGKGREAVGPCPFPQERVHACRPVVCSGDESRRERRGQGAVSDPSPGAGRP